MEARAILRIFSFSSRFLDCAGPEIYLKVSDLIVLQIELLITNPVKFLA
jgi:hypothetical protein